MFLGLHCDQITPNSMAWELSYYLTDLRHFVIFYFRPFKVFFRPKDAKQEAANEWKGTNLFSKDNLLQTDKFILQLHKTEQIFLTLSHHISNGVYCTVCGVEVGYVSQSFGEEVENKISDLISKLFSIRIQLWLLGFAPLLTRETFNLPL